jgi:hypothetical protein
VVLEGHVIRNAELGGQRADLRLGQRGAHEARADRVAGDVHLRHLQRHRLGEADDAVLGGDISGLEGARHQAVGGGDVDDAAMPPRAHAGQRGGDGVEIGGQVDGDDAVPLRRRELLHRADELDAGIVHQDVEPAQRCLALGHHGAHRPGVGHVGGAVGGIAAGGAGGGDLRGAAEAVQHHPRPALMQQAGDAQPDSAGRAGDERGLALEHNAVP